MKLTNFLKVGAIALLFSLTLASCKKEEQRLNNEMSYNDQVTTIAKVTLWISTTGTDGSHARFYDASGNKILDIELAASNIGKTIDLSKADPYSGAGGGHYLYYVYNDDDAEPEIWTSKLIYLCGDEKGGPVYADKGSYLLIKKIDDDNYLFDLNATKNGYKLEIYYSGAVEVSQ